jgi:hypothetical protein
MALFPSGKVAEVQGFNRGEDRLQDVADKAVDSIGQVVGEGAAFGCNAAVEKEAALPAQAGRWP